MNETEKMKEAGRKFLLALMCLALLSGIAFAACPATGGTVTQVGGYCIHTFTASGTFTASSSLNAEVLVVAGGGAGGGQYGGGGGGAGGLIYNSSYPLTAQSYTVTVGNGGVGRPDDLTGYNGGNSQFSTIISSGGGGGDSYNGAGGANGGSGGGGTYIKNPQHGFGIVGQGKDGGHGINSGPNYGVGGGGGAGANGADGTPTTGGNGGVGLNYAISGSNVYYAGGGGGATYNGGTSGTGGLGGGGAGSSGSATSGTANTGGGGGGAERAGSHTGGSGGSGIVIVKYLAGAGAPPIVCGDSAVDGDEECDPPTTCTPAYGGSCQYCNASCKNVTVQGGVCGDGTCQAVSESYSTCHADCGSCGDGTCQTEESHATCAQDCPLCPSGMVGYWNFDEGQGAVAGDSGPNILNGAIESGASWTNGKVGKALLFPGSGGVNLGNSPLMELPNDFTIAAWIYPYSSQQYLSYIISKTNEQWNSGRNYELYLQDWLPRLYFETTNAHYGWRDGPIVTPNKWTFIAITRNRATGKMVFYTDTAIQEYTYTTETFSTGGSSTAYIGRRPSGLNFNGIIDEVALFNRNLSQVEIQQLYSAVMSGKGYCEREAAPPEPTCPDSMVAYWKFDDQSNPGKDSAGTNDTTCSGTICPAYTASGKVGGAYNFDGSDDYLRGNHMLNMYTAFTVEGWFNADAASGSPFGDTTWTMDSSAFHVSNGGCSWTSLNFPSINGQGWKHFAATYDGSTMRAYQNGVLVGSAGKSGPLDPNCGPPNGFFIGGRHNSDPPSSLYKGMMDEVAIYNVALDEATIIDHYNNGTGKDYCGRAGAPVLCGNGEIDEGEQCDPPAAQPCTPAYSGSCSYCNDSCKTVNIQGGYCGDGTCQTEESHATCSGDCPLCPTGMVGYWKFDEGSGATTKDELGLTNPGQIMFSPWTSNGRIGSGIDARYGQVDIPDSQATHIPYGTICYWMYPYSLVDRCPGGVEKGGWVSGNPYNGFILSTGCWGSGNLFFETYPEAIKITLPLLQNNRWSFVCGLYGDGRYESWLDGELAFSHTTIPTLPMPYQANPSMTVGTRWYHRFDSPSLSGDRNFDGIIDELVMFDRALSSSEIKALYDNTKNGVGGYCQAGAPPDTDAPSTSLAVDSPNPAVYDRYPGDVTADMTSLDSVSGVKSIKYSYSRTDINGDVVEQVPETEVSGDTVQLPLTCACDECASPDHVCINPCCTYYIEYWAEDNANNTEDHQYSTVMIDPRAANQTIVPDQPTTVSNVANTVIVDIPQYASPISFDLTIAASEHSFAPGFPGILLAQPLDIGPPCTDMQDQSTCEETNGCMWNEELAMCDSITFLSPVTITMPGDCSGTYGDLISQKIAKYHVISGSWDSVSTCDPEDIGGGIYSCQEGDGRTMTWNTNTCTMSVQTWSFSMYALMGLSTQTNEFIIGDVSADAGDTISIPISLRSIGSIAAMQFIFVYPGLLEYQGMTQTSRTSGAIEAINPDTSGILRYAALYGMGPDHSTQLARGEGGIYDVNFKVSDEASPGEYPLSLTEVKIGNMRTDSLPVEVSNGTLTIISGPKDKEPPVTTAILSGTEQNGWFSSDVNVELIGTDNVAVASMHYCLDIPSASQDCSNTGNFVQVDSSYDSFSVTADGNDGTSTIYYYSVDTSDNVETSIKSSSFSIDTAPPSTSDNIPSWWIAGDYTVTMDASDDVQGIGTSGVSATYVCINSTPSCTPVIEPPAYNLDDGVHYIRYYSIDNAGNVEEIKTKAISIDNLAPVTSAVVTGNINDQEWANDSVDITISGYDPGSAADPNHNHHAPITGSGINATYQCTSFEGNDCAAYTQTDVPGQGHQLISGEGRFIYRYYSEDNGGRISPYSEGYEYSSYDAPNTGNAEIVREITVNIDTSAPSTTMESSCSQNSCTVTLSAEDPVLASGQEGSGIAKVMYKTGAGAWQEYNGAFTVTDEGRNSVLFYATDNAGNAEATQEGIVIIDTKAPMIEVHVAGTQGDDGWYVSPVSVVIKAIEPTSDIDQLCTDVNGTNRNCAKQACGTG